MNSIQWTAKQIKQMRLPSKSVPEWHADLVCDAVSRRGEMTAVQMREALKINTRQLQMAVDIAVREGRVNREWAGPKGYVIGEAR